MYDIQTSCWQTGVGEKLTPEVVCLRNDLGASKDDSVSRRERRGDAPDGQDHGSVPWSDGETGPIGFPSDDSAYVCLYSEHDCLQGNVSFMFNRYIGKVR